VVILDQKKVPIKALFLICKCSWEVHGRQGNQDDEMHQGDEANVDEEHDEDQFFGLSDVQGVCAKVLLCYLVEWPCTSSVKEILSKITFFGCPKRDIGSVSCCRGTKH
jgi:hypothetical protein